ncbi:MAG TPA: CAP domain-containing protein [Candidatus Nanopelagicaceae bacterium]
MKKAPSIILLIIGLLVSGNSAYGVTNSPPNLDAGWLANLNYYRQSAGLNPVTEDKQRSASVKKHMVYLVMSDPKYFTGAYSNAHSENPASPYYTIQGANNGDELTSNQSGSEAEAIDSWMVAPFHATGLMREGLKTVGFARVFNPATGSYDFGMSIFNNLSQVQTKVITFPGNGSLSRLDSFQGENPDPRQGCGANWEQYKGFPIWVSLLTSPPSQISAVLTPPAGNVLASPSDVCVITERNFVSTDSVYGPTGKSILTSQHLVLIIPKAPLKPGVQNVTLSMQGHASISWAFTIVGAPPIISWTLAKAVNTIAWNESPAQANNPVTNYDVIIGDLKMKSFVTFRTTVPTFTSTELDPAQYWVCIEAVGQFRNGSCPVFNSFTISPSPTTASTISIASLPSKIRLDPILDNPTNVTWKYSSSPITDPKKIIQSASVKIRVKDAVTNSLDTNIPITSHEFTPPILNPGDYQMCVTTENSYGQSGCLWEDFSVIPRQKQTIVISPSLAARLPIPGSITALSLSSYLDPISVSLTPSVCTVTSIKGNSNEMAKTGGSCLLRITNPGDNLNLPLDAAEKISIAKQVKIKCINRNKFAFWITGYNPKCPAI